MEPLQIHVRYRVLFVKIQVEHKFIGSSDYTLFDKNGVSIYVFRNNMGNWSHVYGTLADDVREACLDALILRFDKYCTEMFYYNGVRQVVDVSFAIGGNSWHVLVNRYYVGSIKLSDMTMQLQYNEQNQCEVLTPDRIEKYFQWIRDGKIKGG